MSIPSGANNESDFHNTVLLHAPHFIADQYRKCLSVFDAREYALEISRTFELTLRTIAIIMVSQHLANTHNSTARQKVDEAIRTKLLHTDITIGTWHELILAVAEAYKDHHDVFIIDELYSLFWITTQGVSKPNIDFLQTLERLVIVTKDIQADAHLNNPLGRNRAQSWQSRSSDAMSALQHLFRQLTFVQNLRLVYVRDKVGEETYRLDDYSGIAPKLLQVESIQYDLKCGQFYLVPNTGAQPLNLHPMLVFWEKYDTNYAVAHPDIADDKHALALYQCVATAKQELVYLIASGWDYRSVQQLFYEWHDIIALVTWEKLRTAALLCSSDYLTSQSSKSKYQSNSYLERARLRQLYAEFLQSDKRCLVIFGKSGVGKTSFLLNLLEDFQADEDVCIFPFSGPSFDIDNRPVGETIANTISDTIAEKYGALLDAKQLWQLTNQIDKITDLRVVLSVDAINEHTDSKRLLKSINELIYRERWPWRKVIVTCRTEAWKVLRSGVELAEHLYFASEDGQLGVELEQFDEIEVLAAYRLYKTQYGLLSKHEELSKETLSLLQDPLMLRLLAEVYRDKTVPPVIGREDLIPKYLEALQHTKRISGNDIRYLEEELMPLMISDGHYANFLSSGSFPAESKFEELLEHQSVMRLLDVDILVRQADVSSESRLSFKYERFFDHFGHRRLLRMLERSDRDPARLESLVGVVESRPFMWTSIVMTLRRYVVDGNERYVLNLGFSDKPSVRKAAHDALVSVAFSDVRSMQSVKVGLQDYVNNLTHSSGYLDVRLDSGKSNAKIFAADVASTIQFPQPLIMLSDDRDSLVRDAIARRMPQLWRRDQATAATALMGIIEHSYSNRRLGTAWLLPNQHAIETMFVSMLLIFIQNYDQQEGVLRLQRMAQKAVETLLPVSSSNVVGKTINQGLLSLIVTVAVEFTGSTVKDSDPYAAANLGEIGVYFKKSQSLRNEMYRLLPLFYSESGSILNSISVLHEIAALDDGDLNWTIVHILIRRGISEPRETLLAIYTLFDKAINKRPASYLASFLLFSFGSFVRRQDPTDLTTRILLQEYQKLVAIFIEKTAGRVYYNKQYLVEPLSYYMEVEYKLFREVDYPFTQRILLKAAADEDWTLLHLLGRGLQSLSNLSQIDMPVLRTVQPLLLDTRPEILDVVTNIVLSVASTSPEKVEFFLADNAHSQELVYRLKTTTYNQDTNALLQFAVTRFLSDAAVSDQLVDSMVLLLGQMPLCKDEKDWLKLVIKYCLNLAYNRQIYITGIKEVQLERRTLVDFC